MTTDKECRRGLYGLANRLKEVVPFHLRANLTEDELYEIKERNWVRCSAAIDMERLLVDIFNGVPLDLEKIDFVLNAWRATL